MIHRDIREPVGLRLGHLAVAHLKEFVEELFSALSDGAGAVHDAADVHVHVVLHALVGQLVARDLDYRDDGVARGGAPAGGEHNRLAAAGHHGGDGGNVVARRVHDDSALFGGPGGLLHHLHHRAGATLADAAQTLLVQGGKSSGLVARGGLAGPAVLARSRQVLLVLLANLNDLVVNLRGGSALCQHVLAADELDGLAHHGGSARIHQKIAELAHRRVGGDARGGVRTAALDAHEQLRDVAGNPLLPGSRRRHVPCGPHRLLDGL